MKRDSMYRSLESDGQTGNRLAKPPPEEPDAGNLHVRVCEGLGRKRPSLLGTTPSFLLALSLCSIGSYTLNAAESSSPAPQPTTTEVSDSQADNSADAQKDEGYVSIFNGTIILDSDISNLSQNARREEGHLCIAGHMDGVSFRNLQVKEITPANQQATPEDIEKALETNKKEAEEKQSKKR